MQVLASGQAGIFAVQNAGGYKIQRIDSDWEGFCAPRELRYFFSGFTDVKKFVVRSPQEAFDFTKAAWGGTRATRLFAMLIEENPKSEDFFEIATILEQFLENPIVCELVENQLYSAPLPDGERILELDNLLTKFPNTRSLCKRLSNSQSEIIHVKLSFENIDDEEFENATDRLAFWEKAIEKGCVRSLVIAVQSKNAVDSVLFSLYNNLKSENNYRNIINSWTDSFKRSHQSLTIFPETNETFNDGRHNGASARQAYERAMVQQIEIVNRIKQGDFASATRFVRDLIVQQSLSSAPEHIAKSLTNLSQQAKLLQVYELALEWAQQAIEFKPDDGWAHAQTADILMHLGRYLETEQHLELAATFGEPAHAASGRARILRYRGQSGEALKAYRSAKIQYRGVENEHYLWSGVAESLRDLDRLDEALDEYDAALRNFEYEAALHAGRAATLFQMGRIEEAREGYRKSIRLDKNNVVPRNGLASIQLSTGELIEAEESYRGIIADHPFDIRSKIGLNRTLRERGKFKESVAQAIDLVESFPSSPDAKLTLAYSQASNGEFQNAIETLNKASLSSQNGELIRSTKAWIETRCGKYEIALATYDNALREFPNSIYLNTSRAAALRRLGKVNEAMSIYNRLIEKHPERLKLKNAVASIYIYNSNFDAALQLLDIDNPRTKDEWRNFFLHGMLDFKAGFVRSACERFEWGIERCQFVREKRMLSDGLATAKLQLGEAPAMLPQSDHSKGTATELVQLHIAALQTNKGPARALFDRLKENFSFEVYVEVSDEIARRYDIIDGAAKHSREWIFDEQSKALILEAA